MINFKEIFVAWKASIRPTEFQSKVAKDRLDVCIGCELKKEIFEGKKWSAVCGKCGCPLEKKIFSQETSPCPMGYWDTADSKNGLNIKLKDKKTFL